MHSYTEVGRSHCIIGSKRPGKKKRRIFNNPVAKEPPCRWCYCVVTCRFVSRMRARNGSHYYQNICKLQARWKHISFRIAVFVRYSASGLVIYILLLVCFRDNMSNSNRVGRRRCELNEKCFHTKLFHPRRYIYSVLLF